MATTKLVDYKTEQLVAEYDGILLRSQVESHSKELDATLLEDTPEVYFEGQTSMTVIYYVESWETHCMRVQDDPSLWTTQKIVTTY